MQPVLTAEAAAKLDAEAPVPVEVLMDRAGLAVALAAVDMGAAYGRRVVVLAGPGNNGGDGYVAATYLARRGVEVSVVPLAAPRSPACRWAETRARRAGVTVEGSWRAPRAHPPSLVIDALFGAGFRGEIHDRVAAWTEVPAPVLSVDVPSGLDASSGEASGLVFSADRTATFHALKPGHLVGRGPDLCGTVTVADIGLAGGDAVFWLCEEGDALRPSRPRLAHKWSAGSVMVVGGTIGMTGAALLTARSALRFGAGAVAVAAPATIQPVYAAAAPELLTAVTGEDSYDVAAADAVLAAADRFDVLVVGPGLGSGAATFVRRILEGRRGPLLVDADAIAAGGLDGFETRAGATVLTPHAGEFTRLTGQPATFEAALSAHELLGAVVLLKGAPTFVAGSRLVAVASGGRELATIGTGDVLAGMAAALWARGSAADTAAWSAAYWHGVAACELAGRRAVTADALSDEIARWAW